MTWPNSIVIDKDVNGWGRTKMESLKDRFSAVVFVGETPMLPEDASDAKIVDYCIQNECGFATADRRAMKLLVQKLGMTRLIAEYWVKGGKVVYIYDRGRIL